MVLKAQIVLYLWWVPKINNLCSIYVGGGRAVAKLIHGQHFKLLPWKNGSQMRGPHQTRTTIFYNHTTRIFKQRSDQWELARLDSKWRVNPKNAFRTILPGYRVRDDVQMTHAVMLVPLCMNPQLYPSGTQSSDRYEPCATSVYKVKWECGGQSIASTDDLLRIFCSRTRWRWYVSDAMESACWWERSTLLWRNVPSCSYMLKICAGTSFLFDKSSDSSRVGEIASHLRCPPLRKCLMDPIFH